VANKAQWEVDDYTGVTALSSDFINTLASNTLSCRSALISNSSSSAHIYGAFELVAWIGTGTCTPYCTLYGLPYPDLTNGPSTQDEEALVLGVFPWATATSTGAATQKRISLLNVTLPPTDFAVALKNVTGQAFSTALGSNALRYWLYDVTGNG